MDSSAQIMDSSAQILDSNAQVLDSSAKILDSSAQILGSSAQILGLVVCPRHLSWCSLAPREAARKQKASVAGKPEGETPRP